MQIPEYENYHETKSHSTPDFPYNAYICSIPLDFEKVPLHWHDEVEIIYIKKGRGRVTLDFTSLYVEAGDIIIVSPGQLHAIGPAEDSMEYENIIFSLDLLCTGSMDALSSEFFEPFLAGTIGFEHLVCCDDEHYPALSSCLNHIDSISSSFPKGYRLAIKGALFTFFYTIFTNSTDIPAPKNDPHIERLKSVLKYIETNYMNTISIDEISSVSGFSASHFMRFFKSAMGTSFTSYLSSYRLSMAARLLLLTNDSILILLSPAAMRIFLILTVHLKNDTKRPPANTAEGLMKHNDLLV